MASSLVMQISRSDLSTLAPAPNASVTEPKHLASYNWIEAKTPSIVVPGLPSVWRGDNASRQVKKDSGLVYIAQNAARHPESPLEPLFRALYVENPLFDVSSVDIISDRNNLRKLLTFVDPSSDPHGVKDFNMRMEFVNGTAILHREETKTREVIGLDEFRGFGHEFEKAYTRNQIPSSTGHYRIVSYCLGTLGLVIRHETDGYVDDGAPAQASKPASVGDDLSGLLSSMSISQPTDVDDNASTASNLTIQRGGQSVALESTLEIKTRVQHKPLKIADVAPQLWLSQTPKLVRAYHNKGRFSAPVVEDVSADVKRWERANQEKLGKLVTLLISIIAKSETHGCVSIEYSASKDRLRVEQCAGNRMFPEDLYKKWQDDGILRQSDQETKQDGMLSASTQTNESVTAGASSAETDVQVKLTRQAHPSPATTPNLVRQRAPSELDLPCFVCQRMREGNPRRHASLVSTGEIRKCLLCARDFCDMHVDAKVRNDLAVCEIDHGTYARKHRYLPNVYPSLAARDLALGDQERRSVEEDLD